jgi:hypothetical protein
MKFKYLLLFSIIKSTNQMQPEESISQEDPLKKNLKDYLPLKNQLCIKKKYNKLNNNIVFDNNKKFNRKKFNRKNLGQKTILLNKDGQIIKEINHKTIKKLLNQGFKIV